jgi:mono/diheme cytochrome c family protein
MPTYPEHLSDTGLYSDIEAETLAEGVLEYHPAYELWSDGATKRRWVKLPALASIDTSDMNFWEYPTGTQLFKEFSVEGERIETRMLHKQPGGWAMVAYLWNDEQTEATAVPGGEPNAHGTMHDVPGQGACGTCHGKMKDKVLGFSALQLSHHEGGVTLDSLVNDDVLSSPPEAPLIIPGNATAQAALGYLHANCGICHNDESFVSAAVGVKFWLTAESLDSVSETPTYETAVDRDPELGLSGADKLIAPGEPLRSSVILRMQLRGDEDQMPPIASEQPDDDGIAAVSAWIDDL